MNRGYKKLTALIVLLLILTCMTYSKTYDSNKRINIQCVESAIITALPSPPKIKEIDKKDDIEKIINFINSTELVDIEQEDRNGWVFHIQTEGEKSHSISFIGNKIKIDGIWYRTVYDELNNFKNIYSELDYEEIPFSDYYGY